MAKILVIDDDDDFRETVLAILTDAGHRALGKRSGEECAAIFAHFSPDLVICDIRMELMSGYEVLKAVRKNPNSALTPFILATGYGDRESMRQGMELGADDFLFKPFSASELLGAVQIRLSRYGEFAQTSERKLEELRSSILTALPHEFRTPLNAILGFSKILIDDQPKLTSNEIYRMSKMIHDAGLRLHRLIETYLLYAQIELIANDSRRLEKLRSSPEMNVDKIVAIIAERKAREFDRTKDVKLNLENAGVAMSYDSFVKITEELIDNAFKFSKKGSTVVVEARVTNKEFNMIIQDKGHGMTPDQISEIGAYMQFDRKLQEQQGSGFGLIISKRLIEIYKGSMKISSSPVKGTTIEVVLPLVTLTAAK